MELIFILTSFLVATLIALLVKRRDIIEFTSIIASIVAFAFTILVALKVSSSGVYTPFPFFSVDSLVAIIMLIIAFVGLSATAYSIKYLRRETAKNIIGLARVKQYFILLNLFLAAMYLAVFANSPILAWISIEATTLSTAFLISFYNKPSSMEAAWKYLIINSIGLLLAFFGTLLYFTSVNSLGGNGLISWQSLLDNVTLLDPMIAKIAFIFVLIGYGTKVGFAPMHTWKPDAYSKAPAPLGALFSGALFPVAFALILKFKTVTDASVGPLFSQQLLIVFGLLSVIIAASIMLAAKNYKRLLAYSSIEHAGIIALGFGFGGLGIFAAILHIIYHSLIKTALFLSSGNFLLKYDSAKICNIKGAINVIPVTSIIFFTGFLAITGAPPFGILLTKIFILSEGIKTYPIVSVAVIFLLALLFIGFFKQVIAMIFGEKPTNIQAGEESVWLIIPPLALLVIVAFISFYIPPFLYSLINDVVSHY